MLKKIIALLLSCAAYCTQAQTFTDPAFEALYAAEKYADLERAATQRVATQPDDAQAVLAIALNALRAEDAKRRNAAIGHAEVCLQRQPQAAACHYALGAVLGVQAVSEGMFKLMGSVSRIRTALGEALALAPTWFAARSAMVEFYLQAPGVVGGSASKALETARAANAPQQVRALEARITLHDKKYERTLLVLGELKAGEDSALDEDVRAWSRAAAFGLVNEKMGDKARPFFERSMRERPAEALGAYGLARVLADAGDHAQALKLLEQSAKLKGADELPLDYRAGITHQALGDKEAARAAFTRFINKGKGQETALNEAKKRLAQLGT